MLILEVMPDQYRWIVTNGYDELKVGDRFVFWQKFKEDRTPSNWGDDMPMAYGHPVDVVVENIWYQNKFVESLPKGMRALVGFVGDDRAYLSWKCVLLREGDERLKEIPGR